MKRVLAALLIATLGSGVAAIAAMADAPASAPSARPAITLWRLDCGSVQVNDLNVFSDTEAYTGQSKTLASSCYLIRHGSEYMLWDAGLPAALLGAKPNATDVMSPTVKISLVDQLARIGVKPDQIAQIGISHLHFDHIGQAASFPKAKLLIGDADLALLKAKPTAPGIDAAPLKPWIEDGAPAEGIKGDRDIYGDGSVVMLDMPGHTPGHHALLVRLAGKGPVLLTGDLWHFTAQVASNGVPGFNTNRADTLASFDRFTKLAANTKATVVIQHEPDDIAKLPAFPKGAE